MCVDRGWLYVLFLLVISKSWGLLRTGQPATARLQKMARWTSDARLRRHVRVNPRCDGGRAARRQWDSPSALPAVGAVLPQVLRPRKYSPTMFDLSFTVSRGAAGKRLANVASVALSCSSEKWNLVAR